ncbi:MAG: hypothetical protein CMJ25_10460 [Phycisphaerae bacterium]|nr:hypothetical protein [Phycisphaerae bacterium]
MELLNQLELLHLMCQAQLSSRYLHKQCWPHLYWLTNQQKIEFYEYQQKLIDQSRCLIHQFE